MQQPVFSRVFLKTGWAGIQSFMCITRVLAHIKPQWGRFSAHNAHVQCLTSYRTSVRLPHRSTGQNCEKNTNRQERSQRTRTGETRKLHLFQLYDIDGELNEFSVGYLEVSEAQSNSQKGQEVLG